MTTFTIHGPLRGKGRPRFAGGHAYTPATTREYERQIQGAWMMARGQMLDGPVALDVVAYQALPKSASKALRAAAERGEIWPIRKPDIDNVIKLVMDAICGLAYRDDTQVVQLDARKEYTQESESRLVITVREAEKG